MYRLSNGRPLQDTAHGGNIPPFRFNINKRQRCAIEDRMKEKYFWQQADKQVIKAARKTEENENERDTDSGGSLLSKLLPCFLRHYSGKCVHCSVT